MLLRKPRSVVTNLTMQLPGYNGVAAVAAVIRNALFPLDFVTALDVVRTHNLQAHLPLGMVSAADIAQRVVGVAPRTGRHLPWEPAALSGHYALFCLGAPRVVYGQRSAQRQYQLYDPIPDQFVTLGQLQAAGCGPFVGYLFTAPAEPAPL